MKRGHLRLALSLAAVLTLPPFLSASIPMITIEPTVLFERPHYKVVTPGATWFYDAAGGGFSKLIDPDGTDWIHFKPDPLSEFPASAAAGYRGMPNAVHMGADGGAGHPGFDQCETEFIAPSTLRTTSKSGLWQWEWAFFENHAEFSLTRADPTRAWWFLFEGNPGGSFSPESDLWAADDSPPREERPTIGDQLSESFTTVWFGHVDSPRRLVLRHADGTPLVSNLWWMGNADGGQWASSGDGMLVFGFGRGKGADGPLLRGPHRFTVAFAPALVDARPRLAILTDIGGDPDDQQSLVRLMAYANEFELEAFIASASGTPGELKESITRPDLIRQTIEAYGKVRLNLMRHAAGWPEADDLLARVKSGNPLRGREHVGAESDTEGSAFLIERIDAGTPDRPINIAIWGGQTDLAQALWRVRTDRGPDELEAFVVRFRVFDINDQDDLADWMRETFPGMRYILAKASEGQDKRMGTYRGIYLTGDESLTSLEWIESNVRSTGPLGALYPTRTWTAPNPHGCMKEGDTPSWFFFLPFGGNNPDDPTQPGWGGQYQRETEGWYRDIPATEDFDPRTAVSRWRSEYQADFARRMAWCRP